MIFTGLNNSLRIQGPTRLKVTNLIKLNGCRIYTKLTGHRLNGHFYNIALKSTNYDLRIIRFYIKVAVVLYKEGKLVKLTGFVNINGFVLGSV